MGGKAIFAAWTVLCLIHAPLTGQTAERATPEQPETVAASTRTIVLRRDTPVHLMVLNEVSTKEHGAGHRFKLRVNRPVEVDGMTLVPVGTLAYGEVTSAESSGNVGKSGKVSARLLNIDLNGRAIPLSGDTSSAGNAGTAETIMGVLALGPFGLFAKGNNAKIKAGELMNGFTACDTLFELSGRHGEAPAVAAIKEVAESAVQPATN